MNYFISIFLLDLEFIFFPSLVSFPMYLLHYFLKTRLGSLKANTNWVKSLRCEPIALNGIVLHLYHGNNRCYAKKGMFCIC